MPLFDRQFIRVDGYVDQNAPLGNLLRTNGYAHTDLPDSIPANNSFVLKVFIISRYCLAIVIQCKDYFKRQRAIILSIKIKIPNYSQV